MYPSLPLSAVTSAPDCKADTGQTYGYSATKPGATNQQLGNVIMPKNPQKARERAAKRDRTWQAAKQRGLEEANRIDSNSTIYRGHPKATLYTNSTGLPHQQSPATDHSTNVEKSTESKSACKTM